VPGIVPVNAGRTRLVDARPSTFIYTTATLLKLTDEDGSDLICVTNARKLVIGNDSETEHAVTNGARVRDAIGF
jgi:hypothetical protein